MFKIHPSLIGLLHSAVSLS